jgi:hypothetical protein
LAPAETRLAKNRVSSARNPVGKKPGFLNPRNPVGKKPGFLIANSQKPGWQKTGFLNWQKTGFLEPQKNRVS